MPYAEVEKRIHKDLRSVKAKLRGLVTSNEARCWLVTDNSLFDGRSPVKAIHDGETGRVLEALAQVEEGIYV